MKNNTLITVCAGLMLVCIMLSLGACMYVEGHAVARTGPSPHGYRAAYTYRYYPGAQIYFDVRRNVYFYMSGGAWVMRAALPVSFSVNLASFVTVELDTDKPYHKHSDHVRKYPPGQFRKRERHKENQDKRREQEREKRKKEEERNRKKKEQERERKKKEEEEKKKKEEEEKGKKKGKGKKH